MMEIKYINGEEVCQGGPIAYELLVDKKPIKGRFDKSHIILNDYIYIPIRKMNFFKSGYALVRIKKDSLEVSLLTKIFPYMKLSRIEDNVVFFKKNAYNDIEESVLIDI